MSDNEITSIVIVGHVDHGKSTFIGRLLFDTNNLSADRLADIKKVSEAQGKKMEFAYITDQFQEERDANITIDTTQTFLKIDGKPYVIIDAPGHKEYLKNMITGATQAKHAIMMLDVNEGVREQTDKHARILKLLGIESVAILINKMDTLGYKEESFRQHEKEIQVLLKERALKAWGIIPISAYEGENVVTRSSKMDWYKGPTAFDFLKDCALAEEVDHTGALCLPVQLIHEVNGIALVLGKVERGQIESGKDVVLFPSGKSVRIQKILKFKEELSKAESGECVALQVEEGLKVKRGNIFYSSATALHPTRKFSAHLFWAAPDSVKVGDKLDLECRTQSAQCQIEKIQDQENLSVSKDLKSGDLGLVQMKVTGDLLLDTGPLSRIVFHRDGQVAGCAVVTEVYE